MIRALSCPYCDYVTSVSRRSDANLYQHLRDKHGLTDEEIEGILNNLRQGEDELLMKLLKCPNCGGRDLELSIKCTLKASLKDVKVKSWGISRIFYTTLTCKSCEADGKEATFFYEFDDLPTGIKASIFNIKRG